MPQYLSADQYRNPDFLKVQDPASPSFGQPRIDPVTGKTISPYTTSSQWTANFAAQVQWNLIDPARVPQIAAARDGYEKARDTYLIALRELRLNTATRYFNLQRQDEQVRIGQQSVRVSLVVRAMRAPVLRLVWPPNWRCWKSKPSWPAISSCSARLSAIKPKPVVLWRPSWTSPGHHADRCIPSAGHRNLAASLQESIVAAYAFREELDRFILDISINNSNANAALAAVQPILSLVNTFSTFRTQGQTAVQAPVDMADYSWSASNTVALNATWNIFDGGRARAQYRLNKQRAEESTTTSLRNGTRFVRKLKTVSSSCGRPTRTSTPPPARFFLHASRCVWLDCVSRQG